MKKAELTFSAILVPLDFVMLIVAAIAAYFLRISSYVSDIRPVLFDENLPLSDYIILALYIIPFWILFFAISGLYKLKITRHVVEEFFKVGIASSAGLMAIIVYMFFRGEAFDSRFIILIAWVLGILFVILGRFIARRVQSYLASKKNVGVHRVLIIGKNHIAKKIIRDTGFNPAAGYKVIGRFKDINFDVLERKIKKKHVDDIIMTDTHFSKDVITELAYFCDDHYISLMFIPNLFQVMATNIEISSISGYPLIELKRTQLGGWGQIIKRVIDFLGSLFGLILLVPLFVIIALLIKLNSKGPVFVKLKRVGYGHDFGLYKFRSMVDKADVLKEGLMAHNERQDGPLFKMKKDPRITTVGKFLRKTRLDELPQLFNVLRGEMSLVGPRPHEPGEVANYNRHQKRVLLIKPGITGLAQVSGSSDLPFNEEVKLDTFYIENWSFAKDIEILIRTIRVLFFDKSAC